MVRMFYKRMLFLLIFVSITVFLPLQRRGEAYKPGYRYEFAFSFNFWATNSKLFFCKSRPLTFYYRQYFRGGVAEHFERFKGEMLMQFGGGVLTMEGLGLNKITDAENDVISSDERFNDEFFHNVEIKDSSGKTIQAINLFPPVWTFAKDCKEWLTTEGVKINGNPHTLTIQIFNEQEQQQEKAKIRISERMFRSEPIPVGEYEIDYSYELWMPLVFVEDLNGDETDEIIVILTYYRNQTFIVLSTTPDKFKYAREFDNKVIGQMGRDPNWPDENAKIFKAGNRIIIPFRNLEILEKAVPPWEKSK